jgi:hypothetical protein
MELVADFLNSFCNWAAIHFAFLNFAGTAVNDFVPQRFGIRVDGVVKAGDEALGEKCSILFRQSQNFSYFLRSNHAVKISTFIDVLARIHIDGI